MYAKLEYGIQGEYLYISAEAWDLLYTLSYLATHFAPCVEKEEKNGHNHACTTRLGSSIAQNAGAPCPNYIKPIDQSAPHQSYHEDAKIPCLGKCPHG